MLSPLCCRAGTGTRQRRTPRALPSNTRITRHSTSLAIASLARVVEARDHGQEAERRLNRQGRFLASDRGGRRHFLPRSSGKPRPPPPPAVAAASCCVYDIIALQHAPQCATSPVPFSPEIRRPTSRATARIASLEVTSPTAA